MGPVSDVPHRRPGWRKLHLLADEATNEIHAVELTTNAINDREMVKSLVAGIAYPVVKLSGDDAYDQVKVYDELAMRHIQPLIQPRINAVFWTDEAGNDLVHARNESLTQIEVQGMAEWKRQSSYHRRSRAETAMFQWKTIFGGRLWSRLLANQKREAQLKANCLNRFTKLGMPKAVKKVQT